ncbi:type I polyketide synthase [Streptomyces coffeae]|uniref:SDR family NAD(P)-dependent oxidoreductase n=1 Tax=Streptomyces coffeae TaxID=621382 RepID=A0ABS1NMA4_9ACTN|nr:type I polyketide synthase [Streptomyces coffeae]MBL1100886.1 SDR family NAD(P)-dependent oxidoreductase [Streptomyces coffeae]
MNAHSTPDPKEPIAVVGMAGRFPGAPDTDSLWQLLIDGREAIRPVPADRWDTAVQLDPKLRIPALGGFLEDIDLFDAGFFGVSPREAAAMDPQQRLLLEVGWQALEDAGQRASDLAGSRTGVYVATVWHDYELLRKARGAGHTSHTLVGTGRDILANRLSYFMKLRGPSLAVDTGCSSGLVGLDLAARALRSGDIDAALVGSTNLMMHPHVTIGLTHFGGLSPDGRCASFAKSANGFVRGEGVAAVYLKTLAHALRDGDRVHGVLVSTLTNNDGGGGSLVSPSQEGQEDLLRRSYDHGTVPAAALSYVEAHGTGTKRGDPTEAGALGTVLGHSRPAGEPLPIGSIKTNIGHLEGSSGLAGLIKVLLSLRHRMVPPTLHAEELNPNIPFDALNLSVVREPLALPAAGPVYLGVNSFGWGGTNAHVIVASPPEDITAADSTARPRRAATTGLPPVVTLSAHRTDVLATRAAQLQDALAAASPAGTVEDLAGTLGRRRDHFPERAAFVVDDLAQADTALTTLTADQPHQDDGTAEVPDTPTPHIGRAVPHGRTVFVFPGQGSQWREMGVELYRDSTLFASVVDRCAKALAPYTDWDLIDIFAPHEAAESAASGLGIADTWTERTDILQPVLWAMSLGLAELWRASGITPDVVLGTSQGEITAATFAGSLSYDDAAMILARRGVLITERVSGRGLMLAVDLDREAAVRAMEGFEDSVSFAAHNGPNSCVLSGDSEYILALKELLEADGTYCALVNIDYASHSAGMAELSDDLTAAIAAIRPVDGDVAVMSTVDAALVDGSALGPGYWVRNLCEPIELVSAMARLFDEGFTHVVEISPHPVLQPALEQQAAGREENLALLTTLRRGQGSARDMAEALARAYTAGLEPFAALPLDSRFPVPGYPMERQSFWPAESHRSAGAAQGFEATLSPAPGRPGAWQGAIELTTAALPWLADHKLYDTALLPGAGMLAVALHTAQARTGGLPTLLENVTFTREVTVGEEPVRLTAEWQDTTNGGEFRLLSLPVGAEEWDVVATARAESTGGSAAVPPAFPDWGDRTDGAGLNVDPEEFYRQCTARGQIYGPAFQGVHSLRQHPSGTQVLGEIRLAEELWAGARPRVPHPALWDAALQVALALDDGGEALMPTSVRAIRVLPSGDEPATALWSHAVRASDGTLSIRIFDASRRPLLVLEGLELRPLPTGRGTDPGAERLHQIHWADVTPEETAGDDGSDPGTAAATGRWIVCGGTGSSADTLVEALAEAGVDAEHTGAGTDLPLGQAAADLAGVVFFAPRACVGPDAQQRGLAHLTAVVRACAALPALPRLVILTDRAQSAAADDTSDPGAAIYWGYGRVLQREHPELRPRLVDVDASHPDWTAECAAVLLEEDTDDQLALRRGSRLAARIVRGDDNGDLAARPWRTVKQPFRLGVARTGADDSAEFLPLTLPTPRTGEVLIETSAAVVSPADLRDLAALRTGQAGAVPSLGRACAGRITNVGAGVTGLHPGDRVVAVVPGALAGQVLANAAHVVRVPGPLDDAAAAALVLPAAAAWYALTRTGRVVAGDTVLIHTPTLPEALAAVQAAGVLDARVLVVGAAAAEEAAALLDAGAEQVLDPADPDWTDAVRAATGGLGADVALGPRTGAAAHQVWELLAPDGRFVEDATGADAPGPALGQHPVPVGATFGSVDLDGLLRNRPEVFATLLVEVWDLVADGRFTGLPVTRHECSTTTGTTIRLDHAPDRARLVLTDLGAVSHVAPEPLPGGRFRADGAYLITGGLGALGVSLAGFLAGLGAGTLVLAGRSAPSKETAAQLDSLRAAGTTIEVLRCDVADRAGLRQALDGLRDRGLPPLRGVVHAAGVVDDATISQITPRQLARVLRPKADGVRSLEAATAQDPLDFFVMFSSAATLVGNAGQAAYAAANAYLDAFAELRRRRGLPALSVQWGPFADVGLAARSEQAGARLGDRGMESFPVGEAWAALVRMLGQDRAVLGYVPIDLRRWFDAAPDTAALSAWRELYAGLRDGAAVATGSAFLTALHQAPEKDRPALAEDKVRELAARVLRLAPERLDRDALFDSLGLDSLMSLELRNRLEAAFGMRLSPTLLWTYGTLRTLSKALADQITDAAVEKQ